MQDGVEDDLGGSVFCGEAWFIWHLPDPSLLFWIELIKVFDEVSALQRGGPRGGSVRLGSRGGVHCYFEDSVAGNFNGDEFTSDPMFDFSRDQA